MLSLFSMELSRNLRVDSISRLAPSPPQLIGDSEPVSAAVAKMRQATVGCLLVVRVSRLVGIFTDRDLLSRVLAPGLPLSIPMAECLTSNPITVGLKDSVQVAIQRMQSGGYRHLPVVEEGNKPIGILSARRVVHYLVEHFPSLVYNHPPDPMRFPDLPEGA